MLEARKRSAERVVESHRTKLIPYRIRSQVLRELERTRVTFSTPTRTHPGIGYARMPTQASANGAAFQIMKQGNCAVLARILAFIGRRTTTP